GSRDSRLTAQHVEEFLAGALVHGDRSARSHHKVAHDEMEVRRTGNRPYEHRVDTRRRLMERDGGLVRRSAGRQEQQERRNRPPAHQSNSELTLLSSAMRRTASPISGAMVRVRMRAESRAASLGM